MTPEEKELLFKDLCGRLPYNVIVEPIDCGKAILIGIKDRGLLLFDTVHKKEYDKPWDIEYIKPYLRPMSRMTEEETKTYRTLQDTACSYHYEFGDIVDDIEYFDNSISLDYLNSIHIDHRGLIPMGLAIEVTEENNPYK